MLKDFFRAVWNIKNYDRIPKLPSGMLAGQYHSIPRGEARVLARMGARCPAGVKFAMKRAGVDTVEDLARQLEHYQPRRRMTERLNLLVSHFFGAQPNIPHREQIQRAARRSRRAAIDADTVDRVKSAIELFQG